MSPLTINGHSGAVCLQRLHARTEAQKYAYTHKSTHKSTPNGHAYDLGRFVPIAFGFFKQSAPHVHARAKVFKLGYLIVDPDTKWISKHSYPAAYPVDLLCHGAVIELLLKTPGVPSVTTRPKSDEAMTWYNV